MHNVYAGSLAASLSLTQENHKCTYVERQLTCSLAPDTSSWNDAVITLCSVVHWGNKLRN